MLPGRLSPSDEERLARAGAVLELCGQGHQTLVHWPGDTLLNAHFRSEDGRLCPHDQPVDGCLVLRGEIVQCSYPGGFYRYAVRVGPRQYLVDDMRRLAIGEPIGIALPAAALHLYRATSAAESQQAL